MISVIIPLYNKEKTIGRCLKSILTQTYYDLEIIIVDDGSTEGSRDVCEKFADPSVIPSEERNDESRDLTSTKSRAYEISPQGRNDTKIKIFSEGKNYGSNWARNFGAHKANGDYFFFCDADIILEPDALKKLKNALDENFAASYAYCSFKLGWKLMRGMSFDAEKLKQVNYISTMSLIRRKDFPGFDEQLKKFQDWDLWLTMLEQGKRGVFVDETLFTAIPDKRGKSRWLPKIFYKLPLKEVEKYNKAVRQIKEKHNL
ncbi:glycosyltransferase family 2 protein [Patescibacteria group bacterium]|nr:glycosyltransferase family 2 protein [Patescibacteria group bacterium]